MKLRKETCFAGIIKLMVKRSFFILSATKKTVMSKLHTSTEKPMEEIRKFLLKFSGGSIDLIKRPDGIAVITLNQSQKKNAMTGKFNSC